MSMLFYIWKWPAQKADFEIWAKISNRIPKELDNKFDIKGISMICWIRFNNRISKIRQNKKVMTILSHGIQPNYQFKKSPILHSGILIVFAKVFSYCTTSLNKIQFNSFKILKTLLFLVKLIWIILRLIEIIFWL